MSIIEEIKVNIHEEINDIDNNFSKSNSLDENMVKIKNLEFNDNRDSLLDKDIGSEPLIPKIEYINDIFKLSTIMKFITFIEFILVFINIFVISRLFVLLLVFPIIGYYGLREYSKHYILTYSLFVFCKIILDIVLSIKFNPYFIAYLLYDLFNITVTITYGRYIYELTCDERTYLKLRTIF